MTLEALSLSPDFAAGAITGGFATLQIELPAIKTPTLTEV